MRTINHAGGLRPCRERRSENQTGKRGVQVNDMGPERVDRLQACAQHMEETGHAAARTLECRHLGVINGEIASVIRRHDIMNILGAETRLLLRVQLIQVARDSASDRFSDMQ